MDSLLAAPRPLVALANDIGMNAHLSSSLIDAGAEDRAYEADLCGTPLTPLPGAAN